MANGYREDVTPCVGVWIEIPNDNLDIQKSFVTPCVGVWIEITQSRRNASAHGVTPCVGVWIEIVLTACGISYDGSRSLPAWECGLKYNPDCGVDEDWLSLPAWECGLKFSRQYETQAKKGHSLRGSVD